MVLVDRVPGLDSRTFVREPAVEDPFAADRGPIGVREAYTPELGSEAHVRRILGLLWGQKEVL